MWLDRALPGCCAQQNDMGSHNLQLCPSHRVRPFGHGWKLVLVACNASCAQTPLMSSEEPQVAQNPGYLLESPRRKQQSLGAVLLQGPAGLPPQIIRIRIGERCPSCVNTLQLRAQEERPVVSAAHRRLVMESFSLFSPRTSESPCTGTERSPAIPLDVL